MLLAGEISLIHNVEHKALLIQINNIYLQLLKKKRIARL